MVDDDVRRAKVPGAGCYRSGGHGGRVALLDPSGDPPLNQRDLLVAQSPRAHELAVTRFRLPGRHVPAPGRGRDLLGVCAGVRIAQQTERCRSARPMAGRAVLEHDRRDVFGEGHGSGRGRRRLRGARLDGRRRRRGRGRCQPAGNQNQVCNRRAAGFRRHESIFRPVFAVSRHLSSRLTGRDRLSTLRSVANGCPAVSRHGTV